MGSLHLSLPGWMLEPLEVSAGHLVDWFPESLTQLILNVTNAALHKGWEDDKDVIAIGNR